MSSVVAGYVAWIVQLLLLVLNKSYHEEEHLRHLTENHTGVSLDPHLPYLVKRYFVLTHVISDLRSQRGLHGGYVRVPRATMVAHSILPLRRLCNLLLDQHSETSHRHSQSVE